MSYVVTCLHVRRQMAKAAVIMESSFGFSLASIVWEGRSTDSKHRRSREEEQQQRRSSDRLKRATRTQVNNFCAPLPTRCITPLVLNQRVGEKRCQKICTTCPKLSVQWIVNHFGIFMPFLSPHVVLEDYAWNLEWEIERIWYTITHLFRKVKSFSLVSLFHY